MKRIIQILLFTILSISASAQIQRGLIIQLDTQHILIGDQINMTLEMRSHVKDKITFPQIGDSLTADVEVVSKDFPDTSYGDNLEQLIIKQNIKLTAWDSGVYKIQPIASTINGDSAFAQGFAIGVYTFPIDSTNAITDIKGNLVDPLTFTDYVKAYWQNAAIALAIALLIFGIYYYFSKRKKTVEEIVEITPEIPAHILAFQRLKNLEAKKLWQTGKSKDYYVRLSEILREYLENRYQILALEQTTDEIIGDLRQAGVKEQTRNQISELLSLMDLVKFAKQQTLESENEQAIKSARIIIENTKLIPVETENDTKEGGAE